MFQNNINKTLNIYERLTESPFYKFEDNQNNIYLNLNIGYISFICKQRNINLDKNLNYLNIKNFEIDDFYKKATLLKSDKKGFHISLLILQILFYLQENRFDKLSKRLDKLTKYKSRYLDKKEFPRFQLFFKMISLIDKQYNPYDLDSILKIKNQALSLLKQMNSYRKYFNQKLESYEIMPYEVIWEEIMNILDMHAKVKY